MASASNRETMAVEEGRKYKHGDGKETERTETIKVMARVRPIIEREIRNGCDESIQVNGNVIAVAGKRAFSTQGNRSRHRFDKVFDINSTQKQVFQNTQPLIDAALEGYNSTIFAYGQTGTGKTHTMLGVDIWRLGQEKESAAHAVDAVIHDKKLWGIIPRTMQYIFGKLKGSNGTFLSRVSCSYLEIYNEHVYDLLSYEQSKLLKSGLEIREDKRRGVFVPDATEVCVTNEEEVLSILWKGAKNRAMVATDMNTHSSRSHTIFRVVVERKPLTSGNNEEGTKIIRSKINLVDLAGSEKWKPHQLSTFSDTRVKEMTSINQSLSALGNCVRALLERRRHHIPYRNSKLTRLLQDSLGGNTKTAFIVTLSPSSDALEESQSTLQFADRAKKVVVHAMVNETLDDASMLRRYEHQVARLKAMLRKSALQQHAPSASGNAADAKELEDLRNENLALMKQLQDAKKDLHHTKEENRALRRALRSEGGDAIEAERASLEARSKTLEKKMKSVQDAELQQREQKEWLRKYHQWLRSLPVHETQNEGEGESRATLDLKGRLNLLEWSVLMQSEELQRTKRAFLQELEPLQEELHQKCVLLERAEERESELRAQLKGSSASHTSRTAARVIERISRPNDVSSFVSGERPIAEDGYVANSTKKSTPTATDMKSERVFEKLTALREQMHREHQSNRKHPSTQTSRTIESPKGTKMSVAQTRTSSIPERKVGDTKENESPTEDTMVRTKDTIEWIEYFDPRTKRHYYYNEALDRTQWEKPLRYRPATP